MSEPHWVKEYKKFGFSENWLQEVKNKHGENLLQQLGDKSNPVNFYEIKPLNLEENSQILSQLYIPQGYTFSEVLLFILDCLNCLGKNAPNEDSQIYSLYNHLTIDISFDKFYVFIRRLSYIDITQTQQYKLLSKTVKYYTLKTIPIKDSVWEVPYKNGKIKVKIIKENSKSKLNTHDKKIYSQIIDIIEPTNVDTIKEGSKIKLKPYAFNNGKRA